MSLRGESKDVEEALRGTTHDEGIKEEVGHWTKMQAKSSRTALPATVGDDAVRAVVEDETVYAFAGAGSSSRAFDWTKHCLIVRFWGKDRLPQ